MSDKTTAALAAEQADTEATTTQEAELLPAATLDELEQVDLGTVAEGERAPFRITDDRCADWAIRKIADERSEYDRLKALADEQIAAINEKVAAARKRMENGTSYLTSCLADFFATVPHKETKTTEKYRLLSGTLTFKKGTTKTKLDETKLVPWLKANGYGELVKVEESTRWADLKKLLSYTGDIATLFPSPRGDKLCLQNCPTGACGIGPGSDRITISHSTATGKWQLEIKIPLIFLREPLQTAMQVAAMETRFAQSADSH